MTAYLHIFINHKVEAIEIEVAHLAIQFMFDGSEAICHYLLDTILKVTTIQYNTISVNFHIMSVIIMH